MNNNNNISVVSSEVWNNLDKPDECNEIAQQNDIVEYIDGVYFLCQRANNFNNIICLSPSSQSSSSINHILAMFKFCVRLYKYYNIIYIRIEGNTKRYRFLEKIFPKDMVIKDESITDRNVYYCNIEKAHEKLKELSHYDETTT